VTEQAETGYVRHGMHCVHFTQLDAGRVELGGGLHHLLIRFGPQLTFLQRRAHDTHAEPFAEYEYVPRARLVVALDPRRMYQAQCDQSVDRFRRIDRVTAGDGNAGRRTHRLSTCRDAVDDLNRNLANRHAQ
jgi:hypothetical protein